MAAVSEGVEVDYIRLCPTCGAENAPATMRCGCGALLAGIDLTRRMAVAAAAAPVPVAVAPAAQLVCPHDDCAQPNPAGSDTCLYCNRPLATETATDSLIALPGTLRERFRIVRPFPAAGAEAEILLVEPIAGGPAQVAKIYRSGILPKAAVQSGIAQIDRRWRVEMLESGVSDGHAWELMEFCAYGSLRERLQAGPLTPALLAAVIRQLAAAIAGVHAARLVHRDLKPENILVRSAEPLELVLTDFGIASVLDATQRFTSAARTLPYAAPESLSGVIDGKSDYWALGMIVLEAALGRHPFAGLSEAVILHHLTTRSIDLASVADRNLRKLLRGLLLRDPKARWGAAEIERWLAGDPSLAEPAEAAPGSGFAEPYRLVDELCQTPEQLAVALSRHWQAGVADLGNGQLLNWFRTVQKDHNTVRLIIELQHERQLHVDTVLLRLILHLAPGIPPVWRGESIELPAILTRASRALKGDTEAAHWLNILYRHRVLEIYAKAGNAEAAEIVRRWNAASDGFSEAWSARLAWLKERSPERDPNDIVHFDDVVYGQHGPYAPPMQDLHPRLLALAYDRKWADWLRSRLSAEIAGLLAVCPWLGEMGDPQAMSASELLVLEALLPEARKAVERQQRAQERQKEAEADEWRRLRGEAEILVASLRSQARDRRMTPAACDELRSGLDNYLSLLARVRGSGRSDTEWMQLRKEVARIEPVASRMIDLIDELAERRAVNRGWLSMPVGSFLFAAFILLPEMLPPAVSYLVLAVAAGLLAWRLVPNFLMVRQLRELAAKL